MNILGLRPKKAVGHGFFLFPKLAAVSEPVEVSRYTRPDGTEQVTVHHPMYGELSTAFTKVAAPTVHKDALFLPEESVFYSMPVGANLFIDDTRATDAYKKAGLLDKIATVEADGTTFVFGGVMQGRFTQPNAVWELVRAGDTYPAALQKCAAATEGSPVSFHIPAETDVPGPVVESAESLSVCLLKEAAAISRATDEDTVDSVLALNFVTPENTHAFIASLPELEVALAKLAELLVATRLGLKDVPEPAVSSALRGLDRTIDGLKGLQSRTSLR